MTKRIAAAVAIMFGVFALAGGGASHALQRQQTAGKVGCLPGEVKLQGEPDVAANYLTNDIHTTWVAECMGKLYVCTANQPQWGAADVQCTERAKTEPVEPAAEAR